MYLQKKFGVWMLLLQFSSTISVAPESSMVTMKKGVITSKPQYVSSSTITETLHNDMKKIKTTLDRMTDDLEKLGTRLFYPKDESNEIIETNNDHHDTKILNEKLERISRIQDRNSRLINIQMVSLINLEESFDYLEKMMQRKINSKNQTNEEKFSLFQKQVVDKLVSIDGKLDKIRADSKKGEKNDGKHFLNETIEKPNFYGGPNESDSANTIKIAIPNCEILRDTGLRSDVYNLDGGLKLIWGNLSEILCDTSTNGGGWTVIQKRGPKLGEPVNFTRSWNDYAEGFGDLRDEFWLGNEIVHRMTFYNGPHELRIDLEDWDGERAWARYSNFELGPRNDNYRIKISGYTGNATDSLSAHDSTAFSTFDRRNDLAPRCCPCTSDYGGGWWYYSCFEANLNGDYYKKNQYRSPFRGIIWEHWRGNYSLKSTKMMIRSKSSNTKRQMEQNYRNPPNPEFNT